MVQLLPRATLTLLTALLAELGARKNGILLDTEVDASFRSHVCGAREGGGIERPPSRVAIAVARTGSEQSERKLQ